VTDKDKNLLVEGILDYIGWVKALQTKGDPSTRQRHILILKDFLSYLIHQGIAWQKAFTFDTLEAFRAYSGHKGAFSALRALSDYLFTQGRIHQPFELSKPSLPDIYQQYLLYHTQTLQSSPVLLKQIRMVLRLFHDYLGKNCIPLSTLNIQHCDAFMATFKVSPYSRKLYRYSLRGFLKYLYHEKGIIKRDLAPLLVGPPLFAQEKPPKFLRPKQLKKLFASLKLSTPTQIRTYALVHLAYSLGLRPAEISRITLDHISFQQGELTLPERKGGNLITLPLSENTIKAIALYVSKARPQSPSRRLFLNQPFPHRPVGSNTVAGSIANAMKRAGLPSSAYWLRHTYAQNLLLMGKSIYEVKEMLGHQNIQSTQRYLHINTKLMRKVLFNEKL
jgi:integrase/recombinase XerD